MPLHTKEELLDKIEAALQDASDVKKRIKGFSPSTPLETQLEITSALAREALHALSELREIV